MSSVSSYGGVVIEVNGARGATGAASGPLGSGSVTAATVSNSGAEQGAILTKLGGAANDLSNVPGLVEAATDFEGSGVASLKHDRLIFIDPAPTTTDVFGIKVVRRAPTGGTAGWVNAGLIVDLTTQAGTTAFEWGAIFKLDNYANAGQNVALYGQAYKRGDASTGAAVFEAIDPREIANPTSGMPALEVDIRACGTDDNIGRAGIDIVATRLGPDGAHTGADMVCGSGLSFQNGSDVGHAAFGRLIWAKPGTEADIGIDFSVATINSVAMLLAANQPICFSTDLTRKFYHNGSGYQFCGPAGTPVAQIADNGTYYVGANQIIGSRNTGWTASTGTATKGGFNASSVTLPQLASQVKALQDALTLHGLIGS